MISYIEPMAEHVMTLTAVNNKQQPAFGFIFGERCCSGKKIFGALPVSIQQNTCAWENALHFAAERSWQLLGIFSSEPLPDTLFQAMPESEELSHILITVDHGRFAGMKALAKTARGGWSEEIILPWGTSAGNWI